MFKFDPSLILVSHFLLPFSPFTGLNLVIVSRTESRLEDLATDLESKYGVQVRAVAVDLTDMDDNTICLLSDSIKHLDVGILVNNAGMSYDHCEYLEQTPIDINQKLITINTVAPTILAHIVLQGMKERGRGVIVNIGSANGLLPAVPLVSTYAGSKAYINQFTRSMDAEARPKGIRVQDQCPLFVATKMSKIRRARLDAPTPEVWARAAVRQIGYDTVRTPYWFHGVQMAVVTGIAPTFLVKNYMYDMHQHLRTKYYQKLKRDALAAASGSVEDEAKKDL